MTLTATTSTPSKTYQRFAATRSAKTFSRGRVPPNAPASPRRRVLVVLDRLALDRQPRGMPEPLAPAVAIHLFHLGDDVGHGRVVRDPAVVDVREVDRAIRALLPVVEPDRAPERLDVAKHLRAEGVHTCHPVAVQT